MDNSFKNYKYLIFIAMLYITVDLSSMVYAYKEIKIGSVVGMASSINFPLTYFIMSIITEVYDTKPAVSILWFGIICDFVFSIIVFFISFVPSPDGSQYLAYEQVLRPLIRSTAAQTIGIFVGEFINIYLISKWKILVQGRIFWLRSIGSSAIGEAVMLIISVVIALKGVVADNTLIKIIINAYIYKIIFATVVSFFAGYIASSLKRKEGINVYDYNISFSPFKST